MGPLQIFMFLNSNKILMPVASENTLVIARAPGDETRLAQRGVLDEMKLDEYAILGLDRSFSDRSENTLWVFDQWPTQTFETVLLSDSIVLFDHPWSEALLRRAFLTVAPSGRFIVPFAQSRTGAHMERYVLEKYFGPGTVTSDKKFIAFEKQLPSTAAPEQKKNYSVLDWYWKHHPLIAFNADHNARMAAAFEVLAYADRRCDLPQQLAEFIIQLNAAINEDASAALQNDISLEIFDQPGAPARPENQSTLNNAVSGQSYTIGGLRYKAPIISHILREAGPDRALHLTDIGGGYGAMACELLFDPENRVEKVLVSDVSAVYLAYATHLYRTNRDRLAGKFEFSLAPMVQCDLLETDVICFIGSLLFAPKNAVTDILDRVWEKIRPGGLLIVHENIKAPRYANTREYDMMFSAETLNTLLGRYGEVKYYSSVSPKSVRNEEGKDLTLFRVVRRT